MGSCGPRERTRNISLISVIENIIKSEPNAEEIFLFGSRAYKTGSIRSDIDLLVVTKDAINQELWVDIREIEPYIDLFQLIGTNALSLANQSQISSDSKANLIKKIDAVKIWDRNDKWIGPPDYQIMEVLSNFYPELTTAELREFPDPAHHYFDFLIITSIPEEHDALIKRLESSKKIRDISVSSEFVSCEIKTKNYSRKIAISKSHRMGTVAAALNTQRSILALSPKLVILIGITGGIPNEVNLGDIIIPDRIVEYESIKIEEHRVSSHGFIPITDSSARQKISSWSGCKDWQENITKEHSEKPRSTFYLS